MSEDKRNSELPLNDAIGKLCHGFDYREIINALGSILCDAIVGRARSREGAQRDIDALCRSMKENVDLNWLIIHGEQPPG